MSKDLFSMLHSRSVFCNSLSSLAGTSAVTKKLGGSGPVMLWAYLSTCFKVLLALNMLCTRFPFGSLIANSTLLSSFKGAIVAVFGAGVVDG